MVSSNHLSRGALIRLVLVRFCVVVPALFAMFLLPAGTWAYWEAWVYLAILLVPMMLATAYLLKNNPELLERRLRWREKQRAQRLIIPLANTYLLLAFLVPGFDRRWDWSQVSTTVVIVADLVVLLGYAICLLVLRENRYASRVVEVEEGQQLISTGPYALIRHPLYLGVLLIYTASPLALGSFWAFLSTPLLIPLLVARIRDEEKVLERDLRGYSDYMLKTTYRLIPGVW